MRISDWSSDVCSSDLGAKPDFILSGTVFMPASRHPNPSRFSARTGLLAGAALLSACAAVPDLGPQPVARGPASIAAERSLQADNATQWPAEGRWKAYGDPQLEEMLEEGMEGSDRTSVTRERVWKSV